MLDLAEAFGEDGYWKSALGNITPIAEMNSAHLINAILWVDKVIKNKYIGDTSEDGSNKLRFMTRKRLQLAEEADKRKLPVPVGKEPPSPKIYMDIPKEKRVYIHLFHGRNHPDQQLEDWGSDGPTIGPFTFVHITYRGDIKLGITDGEAGEQVMRYFDDLIYYDGVFYGDISIFTEGMINQHHTVEQFEIEKANLAPERYMWLRNGNDSLVQVTGLSAQNSLVPFPIDKKFEISSPSVRKAVFNEVIRMGAKIREDINFNECIMHWTTTGASLYVPVKEQKHDVQPNPTHI